MGYVDKNANILLLFLIVISATGLVAATVYFQKNFEKLNNDYDAKVKELNRISTELESQKASLQKTKSELMLKSSREEEFVEKFSTVKEEKKSLEEAKTSLEKKAEYLESERIAAVAAEQKAEAALGDAMLDLQSAERDRDAWKTKYDSIVRDFNSIQNTINTYISRLGVCKTECESKGGAPTKCSGAG